MNENTMLVPQMGINTEQATADMGNWPRRSREITAGVLTTVNSFCRWIQRVAAGWWHSRKWKWRCAGRRLTTTRFYNRYRHAKGKRIRKKYAKRILEWYRTEVAPC